MQRRYVSIPERLGLLGLAAGVAATGWGAFSTATGLGLPCPLRTLTGIPCPVCGMTTAAVALVHGDVAGAAAANPAVFALAALAAAVVPLFALRAAGVLPAPRPSSALSRRRVEWSVALLAVASWVFQLNRLVLS